MINYLHLCSFILVLKRHHSFFQITKSSLAQISDYVDLYVDHILNKSIQAQFNAFYYGFHSVCASNALIVRINICDFMPIVMKFKLYLSFLNFYQMLRPEDVEMLVCGNPEINMKELRKVTIYDGYSKHDQIIRFLCTLMDFHFHGYIV